MRSDPRLMRQLQLIEQQRQHIRRLQAANVRKELVQKAIRYYQSLGGKVPFSA